MTGYTLGGGLSWLGRKYGWACNNVTSIELVTADGEARTVDSGRDPDLFWALRGGGGGFAIVTALHVNLFPVAEAYAGGLLFPARCLRAGLRPTAIGPPRPPRRPQHGAHDEPPADPRYTRADPREEVPSITACRNRRQGGGGELVAPLREIGEPVMDAFDQIPAAGLTRIAMDPEPPVPGLGHHA